MRSRLSYLVATARNWRSLLKQRSTAQLKEQMGMADRNFYWIRIEEHIRAGVVAERKHR
jgi:hypothetical protein